MPEILIYDEIGPAAYGLIDSRSVIESLAAIGNSDVTVRINSPGGDVFEGVAIHNALKRHKGRVTIAVDALAASAASYVAMAGHRIEIADNAMMMLHNPWTLAMGNAAALQEVVDLLEKVGDTLAAGYHTRSRRTLSEVQDWLDAETWFDAEEAVESGLADVVVTGKGVRACIPPGRFRSVPAALADAPVADVAADRRRRREAELARISIARLKVS